MNKDNIDKTSEDLGYSDEGYPLILSYSVCELFEASGDSSYPMKECWYCKHADFRKSTDVVIENSICKNPLKKITIIK